LRPKWLEPAAVLVVVEVGMEVVVVHVDDVVVVVVVVVEE
jgi:hypothetical protein